MVTPSSVCPPEDAATPILRIAMAGELTGTGAPGKNPLIKPDVLTVIVEAAAAVGTKENSTWLNVLQTMATINETDRHRSRKETCDISMKKENNKNTKSIHQNTY